MSANSPNPSPPGVLRCATPGDLTSTTAPAFRQLIDQSIAARPTGWATLELDLGGARLVDSVGLNLLVGAVKLAQGRGAKVHIVTAHPMVRRILAFTRLDRHAEIVASCVAASQ
jgi:anti-anti-sigma factor